LLPPERGRREFLHRMEDVLELYAEPYDPKCSVVRFDEASKELHDHAADPIPVAPGKPARGLRIRSQRDGQPVCGH
jgi:hypothetical protein